MPETDTEDMPEIVPNDNVSAIRYDPETGRITAIRLGPYADIANEGYSFILGDADILTEYVDITQPTLEIKKRPLMDITQDTDIMYADGSDTMVLSGLPIPCEVTIGGQVYQVPDGIFEFQTTAAGDYKIIVSAFPYMDWESEVIAVASDV